MKADWNLLMIFLWNGGKKMSEKRFELSESVITDYRIYDYKQEDAYFISCAKHTAECLVNLLNSLNEDNEHLEEYCGDLEADVKRLQEISEMKYDREVLLNMVFKLKQENIKINQNLQQISVEANTKIRDLSQK